MGLVSILAIFAFWWHHLWAAILNTPFQKDKFEPENLLSFYFHWIFVFSVLRSIRQGSQPPVVYCDDGRVHDAFPSNPPYWVFPDPRKTILFLTFIISETMEHHIHVLGKFWLDIFVHHYLRRAIVCLHRRLVLFVAHLFENFTHVHGLPRVDE